MTKRRLLFACAAYLAAGVVAISCAGSQEDIFDQPQPDAGTGGSGYGGSAGKAGTSGYGGSSGYSGSSATGGASGSSGTGGKAGTGGASGSSGASGTGGGSGSCNKAFCPNTGQGTPCCVTANGPCGMDNGNGCQGGGGTGADF